MHFSENIASEVESLSWEIAERDPRENNFGFYHYGDRAASQGGGSAVFMWFPEEQDRRDFLVSCIAYIHIDCATIEEFDHRTSLLKDALSNEDASEALSQYNSAMKGIVRVEWIGTFDDLLSSSSGFAQEMRKNFREGADLGIGLDSPITDDELDEFIEFSETMGI